MTAGESPSATGIRNFGTNLQESIHGAASKATSQMSHCRVCLARDHTETKRSYALNAKKLAEHVRLAGTAAL